MSGRSKRTTTTTTVVREGAQTPTSSGTRSPGRMRPPSPSMITRIQEKEELAGLNDRLASYIDKVRSLETDNARLMKQVQCQEETVHREVTNIKGLYESELNEARKLLDATAKEKARLQVDVGNLRSELEDLKDKYNKLDREYQSTKKRVLVAESQVNDLQARLNDAVGQRKHWEDEYSSLKKDYDNLVKQLAAAKKQLEDETVRRVDMENRVQSLKEELAFRGQVHEQELNETISRTRVEIEEVDGKLQTDYESKLAEALREMRERSDMMIRVTREETEEVFEQKLADLRSQASSNDELARKCQEEVSTYRRRMNDMSSELNKLRNQTAAQEARIRDLEEQLAREADAHRAAIEMRDGEVRRLRDSMEEQMREYRDLLDIKIALDMEIAAYHKLLESEETRLNISTASEATPSKTPRGQRATPVSSRKRKRVAMETSSLVGSGVSMRESASSTGFTSSSSAKGAVEVFETDSEGKFIKLYNSGDKDVHVGGWQLRHTAGDEETTYKFHRSANLKTGQYVTVWSAESEQTHSPPTDLVMKSQKWFTGEAMHTVLLSNSGEEVASRDMKRSVVRTSYSTSAGSSLDDTDSGLEPSGDSDNGRSSWLWWR